VARRRLGLAENEQIVLSVGRLHVSKGFPILVEAVARLRAAFPDILVAIVGGPDSEADATRHILDTAQRLGIADRVRLVGPQPPSELVNWYSAADVFCLPTSREGSANVLYEAMSCGLPVVTTPVGGNPRAVSRPELGILADADAASMTTALSEALTRVWNRPLISAIAGSRTWDVVAHECYGHLSSLVGRDLEIAS